MFGYVIANKAACSQAQWERYRSCYCGLCRTIRARFGFSARMTLSYDMTFLALLLSSLYEPEESGEQFRCLAHPLHTQNSWANACFDYCAHMNVILSYYKFLDDWHDDKNLWKLGQASVMKKSVLQAAQQFPRQVQTIQACLESLSRLEAQNCSSPDEPANLFGTLMGELFVWREDFWAPVLRKMGESLGRFLYTLDAVLDLKSDQEHQRYNPLLTLWPESRPLASYQSELAILLGECTEEFEKLPLIQDVDLLRNILYSGIWSKFTLAVQKQAGTKEENK